MKLLYAFPEPLPLDKARGIQVAWMVKSLADAGVLVDLCHVPAGQGNPLDPIRATPPAELTLTAISRNWPIPFQRWHSTRCFVKRLLARIETTQPDVVFIRHFKAAYQLLRANPRIPVIYEAHEVFADTVPKKKHKSLAAQEAYVLRHAAAVIYISTAVKEAIHAQYSVNGHEVVLHSGNHPPATLPEKPWQECGRHIVYTGSFYAWKGVDDLVTAAAGLANCHLKLIGGEAGEIERLKGKPVVQSGMIELIAKIPASDVATHLAQACIAVLPNRPDGVSQFTSPLKLFEYMGAGCAIVAADIPSVREILGNDEASWFTAGDPDALRRALEHISAHPEEAQRQGELMRSKAYNYTWQARALAVKDLAEKTLTALSASSRGL